jgi:hypothetical protein
MIAIIPSRDKTQQSRRPQAIRPIRSVTRMLPKCRTFETRSSPTLAQPLPRSFTLITRTARARASYPSCVAVYPRDSRSRRVLCRSSHSLHSLKIATDLFDKLPPLTAASKLWAGKGWLRRAIRPVKSTWYEYMPRRDSDSWARAYLPF